MIHQTFLISAEYISVDILNFCVKIADLYSLKYVCRWYFCPQIVSELSKAAQTAATSVPSAASSDGRGFYTRVADGSKGPLFGSPVQTSALCHRLTSIADQLWLCRNGTGTAAVGDNVTVLLVVLWVPLLWANILNMCFDTIGRCMHVSNYSRLILIPMCLPLA